LKIIGRFCKIVVKVGLKSLFDFLKINGCFRKIVVKVGLKSMFYMVKSLSYSYKKSLFRQYQEEQSHHPYHSRGTRHPCSTSKIIGTVGDVVSCDNLHFLSGSLFNFFFRFHECFDQSNLNLPLKFFSSSPFESGRCLVTKVLESWDRLT